ncbi:MAG: flagellar biosynthetic protein FliO [Candidatus Magnetomorum sp.]|nr:flagellar biosynthetic protein FliO [Candidatus Magnetomorum sp.]
MELWYTAGKTFAMLCVVLGLLLAFLYALKRLTLKGSSNQEQIKLVSSFSIGPRKQIMLVDVMAERLVLGVTSEHINCLAHYPLNISPSAQNTVTQELSESFVIDSGSRHPTNNNKIISQVQSEK